MVETLPALSTTRLKMRSGPAGTSATTSSASSAKGRETHPLHRETPWLCWVKEARTAVACCPGMGARSRIARWKASQNDFQALKGAFGNLVVVRAAQLSRVIARHTGERRVDVYERLITRWTEPLARQTVTLRNLMMVILPASTGELVKLELGSPTSPPGRCARSTATSRPLLF